MMPVSVCLWRCALIVVTGCNRMDPGYLCIDVWTYMLADVILPDVMVQTSYRRRADVIQTSYRRRAASARRRPALGPMSKWRRDVATTSNRRQFLPMCRTSPRRHCLLGYQLTRHVFKDNTLEDKACSAVLSQTPKPRVFKWLFQCLSRPKPRP